MTGTMIYSIYNYGTRLYDYYTHTVEATAHAPAAPKATPVKPGMGVVPDRAAWPLPSGAVKVGSGMNPKGRIATQGALRDGMGALGDFSSTTNVLAVAGLGYLAWRVWKKKGW